MIFLCSNTSTCYSISTKIIYFFFFSSERKHAFLQLLLSFSHQVESNSLRPHGLQHTRPPCPSPSPRVCSNSCPLSLWCHTTISSANVEWSLKQLCSNVVAGCVCSLEIKHSLAMSSLTILCSCGVLGTDFSFVKHTLPFICYSKCRGKKSLRPLIRVFSCVCMCSVTESCLTLFDPMDCSLPGSSVHGMLQARILALVAISSSRGSSQPRDQNYFFCASCTGRWILYHCATWEEALFTCMINFIFKEHRFIYFQVHLLCYGFISQSPYIFYFSYWHHSLLMCVTHIKKLDPE